MRALPLLQIEERDGLVIVRDDLLPGGTKRRILPAVLSGAAEFVYASPAYGFAQIALAYACRDLGRQATIFTAQRKVMHPRTAEAARAGAKIVMIPVGYLSVVQARARAYAALTGAELLPFGFKIPTFVEFLAALACGLPLNPAEVWTVAGSGTLTLALQRAWPEARFHAVKVGKEDINTGRATVHVAPERFEKDAREPPPFPSCSNYDAKAWRFLRRLAAPGALFWNVAA